MVEKGKIQHYGVSVERIEEALKAIEYPGVETVQIIFNMLRMRPAELFFGEAQARNVGVIVRVPLASGLLTGKMSRESTFATDDHRHYNRHGEAFDVGETFSGKPPGRPWWGPARFWAASFRWIPGFGGILPRSQS